MKSLESIARACREQFHPLDFRISPEEISGSDRAEILLEGEKYSALPWPVRKATDFLAFVRSGSRKADEDPYFLRRKKLCRAAIACVLDQERFLDDVVDGIWCLCEETSWVISAHNVNPIPGAPSPAEYPLPDPDCPYIDLFSAQTGMILTLVRQLLGTKLDTVSPVLVRRVSSEIRKRILIPFMERDDFWWMGFIRKDLCNWTPWIVSGVMLCALSEPMDREKRADLLIRACGMLDRWLNVMPEDGGCDEGAGYWNMAGGALMDCLEMLEESSDGAMSLWQEEKIRNILAFPLRAEIGNGYFLNFADCDVKPVLSGERIEAAGRKIGDPALKALGKRLRRDPGSELSDTPLFSRMLKALKSDPAGSVSPLIPSDPHSVPDVWLPDLQVRIVRRSGWTLAVKGGHNGESHNHNDVGSFMLYVNGEPEIVDAGNMTYTARTFSDRRYELWNTRSAYHNVPVIGKHEQLPGSQFCARQVRCLADGLSLELAGVYGPAAGVRSFQRCLALQAGGLRIRDELKLARSGEVTWVFLFRNQPLIAENTLKTDRLRMEIPAGWKASVEEIPITDPRMARNWPGSLWRVLVTDRGAEDHLAEWIFHS